MSDACDGRWTAVEPIRSSIRCAASDFVFVLLTKTLKSSTFKLALVCVAVFSGAVFALLGYVYWATTNYVRSRCDLAISADRALLVQAYGKAGRDALVTLMNRRLAERGFEGGIYLLADPSWAVLVGSL